MRMEFRIEKDTMGEVRVPADRLWGAQTQRSLENFRVGTEKMPEDIIRAIALVKKCAAIVHSRIGLLPERKAEAIVRAADEIAEGRLDDHFPLVVWQTGSGTQTNMNVNEVIARRANELLERAAAGAGGGSADRYAPADGEENGGAEQGEGKGERVHPNDDVNMGQSSNDVFPTAIHIAGVLALEGRVLPALARMKETLLALEKRYGGLLKAGRTHLQDATPITFGQEASAWRRMLEKDEAMIRAGADAMRELAIGGTAVGTGLNAHPRFGEWMAEELSRLTGTPFRPAANKFHALTSHDEIVFAHGALKALAADLMKIANDIRWMASGPRAGLGELRIPENEPGSSIMPGKVNPTQCEMVTMVACQVMGNDASIGFAASQGNFQLNVFKPLIAYNFLQSARLLADALVSFRDRCVAGMEPVASVMEDNVRKSLMLVTALNPHIGYDRAAAIAKLAYRDNLTLREAAIRSGFLTGEEFDRIVRPERMAGLGGNGRHEGGADVGGDGRHEGGADVGGNGQHEGGTDAGGSGQRKGGEGARG